MLRRVTDLPEIEQRLREIVAAIPPQVRPILLQVLTADEERRAVEIGNLYGLGITPPTVELLIDAEEDPCR